ncbi:MAG: nucleotidyltransferase [Clostridium sp.]|uniref:nucleotidyltransferase n=1 Tax=Clostridium sp. TaxID=1506 RepID=UPI003F2A1A9E
MFLIVNITGIVTEYNPFHLGHKLHLESSKENTNSTHTICIMSGHFMQRGVPSFIDKWSRAKMAVLNGVDLVIELPLIYSLSSAEGFSFGAMKILNATNIVNSIYFGSEHGSIENLSVISDVLSKEPLEYKSLLKENLNLGLPFHKAREIALTSYLKDDSISEILKNSNNILGIEYMKALKRLHSKMIPITLKREGSLYNDKSLSKTFSSATSIRESFFKDSSLENIQKDLPPQTFQLIKSLQDSNYNFPKEEDIFPFLKYKILTSPNIFSNIPTLSEGLDKKILKEISSSNSLSELIEKVKSKRYTYTRISRVLLYIFLSLNDYDLEKAYADALYIRPLAFNLKGAEILKHIKEHSEIDIFTKLPKKICNASLELDILGTKAYSLLTNSISPMDDYKKSPFILKEM